MISLLKNLIVVIFKDRLLNNLKENSGIFSSKVLGFPATKLLQR